MTSEDDFRIRPGRIRSRQIQHAKPFVAQALAAAQKAGGHVSRQGRIGAPRASRFGRGRVAGQLDVDIQLEQLDKRLAQRRLQLEVSLPAKNWLAQRGFDPVYGFHALRHTAVTNVYRASRDLFLAA